LDAKCEGKQKTLNGQSAKSWEDLKGKVKILLDLDQVVKSTELVGTDEMDQAATSEHDA
jgi:hypothetical protein